MNMLHLLRNSDMSTREIVKQSPLKAWLVRHGHDSLIKYAQLELNDFKQPLVFQVNCLQQLQNIASYNFMRDGLAKGRVYLHAFWFDIYSGDIHYFSRQQKTFVPMNEDTIDTLMDEVHKYYS
ncbi:hypothetical protein HAZT_HAZT000893 [Hyalella azteca]|uniref:carbonic anhydrase n=1 Tax=Hyalella azteca TaxID=294128 RepID=A0A6A0GXC4_HYAAZ|nr:hypothetical protein HAZT_HAZT000893 [Hyalella azteca]